MVYFLLLYVPTVKEQRYQNNMTLGPLICQVRKTFLKLRTCEVCSRFNVICGFFSLTVSVLRQKYYICERTIRFVNVRHNKIDFSALIFIVLGLVEVLMYSLDIT